MKFDCGRSRAVQVGNFLVAVSFDHPPANLTLFVRQTREPLLRILGLDSLVQSCSVFFQGQIDRLHQCVQSKWLEQKVNRPFFQGLDDFKGLTLSGDENDRGGATLAYQFVLQNQAGSVGHADIEQNDRRADGQGVLEEGRWIFEALDGVTQGAETEGQTSADRWIIIDQIDVAFEVIKIHSSPVLNWLHRSSNFIVEKLHSVLCEYKSVNYI